LTDFAKIVTNNNDEPEQNEIRSDDFAFVYLDVDNPTIAWLAYRGLLNSPDIATANPGQLSWFLIDILKRGLASTLRREGVLEGYRIKEFPQDVSRLKCVYAHPTIDAAKRSEYGLGKFRNENLVAISPATNEFRADLFDGQWITDFDSLPVDTARRYWSGEHTPTPHLEYLLSGRFYILGTAVRKRAYQTIKRVWPNALALLELSRLAAEFGSDFGSISPSLQIESEHVLVRHIIRYDDQEGPEILRRAMETAKADPLFHVNWDDLEPFRLPPEDRAADERFRMPDTSPYDHELRADKLAELNKFIELVLGNSATDADDKA
jgi:hypothetical protein